MHQPPCGGSAQNVAKQAGGSVIYGHTHQESEGTFVNKVTGQVSKAINAGWLGNKKESVFNYLRDMPNWTQSFCFVHKYKSHWDYEKIKIQNHKAMYRGKVYEA